MVNSAAKRIAAIAVREAWHPSAIRSGAPGLE